MNNKLQGYTRFILAACACLAGSISISSALAVTQTGPLPITRIRTGWVADQFAIETNQTIVNPAGCIAPNGYISNISDPGYKTYYAAVLMAFALGKKVTVIISDTECMASTPKIIGIYVEQ